MMKKIIKLLWTMYCKRCNIIIFIHFFTFYLQPFSRHEVAQVLDKTLSDADVCENTIGNLAGSGLGVALNPISAFVEDAATSVILIIGSKETRKWQFLKRYFLPFLANELFSNHIQEKEDQTIGFYEAVVSLSAFEIQDEIITGVFFC